MKRKIFIVVTALFIMGSLHSQTETLTNGSIIKMAQAKLSDELILDVIQSSPAAFDLSDNGLADLKKENVSVAVIEAMKSVQKTLTPVLNADIKPSGGASGSEALGYVAPLRELITFFEEDFKAMNATLLEWDQMIISSVNEINEINDQISDIEKELAAKKNADANGYSQEIITLKKTLTEARTKYKELKSKMLSDGEEIASKLSGISDNKVRDIGKQFSVVSQQVKSADSDPASGENPVPLTFSTLEINESILPYLMPLTELFYWYQNEIYVIRKTIEEWNVRVTDAVQKNAELMTKLEPVMSQLKEYEKDPKQYKKEISGLKEQQDEIEKQMKALAKSTENESNELSSFIKESGETIQETIEERIADIISNINFLYQEKLNV